jgi:Ca2+-binding EF-hand superfamily protein
MPRFSISAAFQTLDGNNNGYLSKLELKNFLEDHDFFATNKEIDMIFTKIDRDRDDKVTYGEFFGEMAPKLPY